MKAKKFLLGTFFASIATVGVAALALSTKVESERIRATNGYSCGSLKFGFKDSDCTAVTYDYSTSQNIASVTSIYTTDASSKISSLESTNLYGDTSYSYSGSHSSDYSKYSVRIGKSKGLGTLTINFSESKLIGATVYALPYVGKGGTSPNQYDVPELVVMVVNGQEVDLSEAQGPSQKNEANASIETFVPYQFTFEATNKLTLTAKNAKVTVDGKERSASRYYVADIAFRFAD